MHLNAQLEHGETQQPRGQGQLPLPKYVLVTMNIAKPCCIGSEANVALPCLRMLGITMVL